MAFDGIVLANVVWDMQRLLTGGRITKIYQPESDELLLVIKNQKDTFRLQLCAGASLPLVRFVEEGKKNPLTAPNFCMLLRKHISNGKILDINQPGMERIVEMTIEHRDEMGDLCTKKLITEIMGKHSNIIFVDQDGTIIDSIKHISAQISSVREVLPGRAYVAPPGQGKIALGDITPAWFQDVFLQKPVSIQKAIYQSISGISPLFANEICERAGLDGSRPTASLTNFDQGSLGLSGPDDGRGLTVQEHDRGLSMQEHDTDRLYGELIRLRDDIADHSFAPNIIYNGKTPVEFASFPLSIYRDMTSRPFENISQVLDSFYAERETITRIRQKSADLRHILQTALERTARKYDLQRRQLADTDKRDLYRIRGEMLHTYGYSAQPGDKELTCVNYYDGKEIRIPLDPTLTAMENAKKYFDRYGKLKRTYEALTSLVEETGKALSHLESIGNSLDMARTEEDLAMIREELIDYGYMKRKGAGSKKKKADKSKPLHYISSDGFHIYVGKNNYQNDELSFKIANGKDMWFHAKKMAGSHVIVKLGTADQLPDATYEEAARLAAYYSKGKDAPKVEVDYTERRQLKKPPHAVPGYVIYHQNWSMSIEPDISGIREIQDE